MGEVSDKSNPVYKLYLKIVNHTDYTVSQNLLLTFLQLEDSIENVKQIEFIIVIKNCIYTKSLQLIEMMMFSSFKDSLALMKDPNDF